MKSLIYSLVCLGAAVGVAVTAGCGHSGTAAADSVLVLDTIKYADSIRTDSCTAKCDITLEYPVDGPEPLADSVRRWIAERLDYNAFSGEEKPFGLLERHEGNKLVKELSDSLMAEAKVQLAEFDSAGISTELEYECSVEQIYATPALSTFSSTIYVYLGGAHGGTVGENCTFDAYTGTRLGWNIFLSGYEQELGKIIKEGLKDQFFEVKTDDELQDRLLVNADALPLPRTQPYLMADGVHFIYQQYEIAPYSEGMPGCVVPYSRVKNLMAPAVLDLVTR